ncbi:hypothetical protein V2J09_013906 [Rumex salicifolius]
MISCRRWSLLLTAILASSKGNANFIPKGHPQPIARRSIDLNWLKLYFMAIHEQFYCKMFLLFKNQTHKQLAQMERAL